MQAGETRQPDVHDRPDPTVWVDEHGNYLFRYAAVRLRDDNLAEDLVQETLLSAIESAGEYYDRCTIDENEAAFSGDARERVKAAVTKQAA